MVENHQTIRTWMVTAAITTMNHSLHPKPPWSDVPPAPQRARSAALPSLRPHRSLRGHNDGTASPTTADPGVIPPSGNLRKLWKTRFYFAGVSRIEEANHLYMDRFP